MTTIKTFSSLLRMYVCMYVCMYVFMLACTVYGMYVFDVTYLELQVSVRLLDRISSPRNVFAKIPLHAAWPVCIAKASMTQAEKNKNPYMAAR